MDTQHRPLGFRTYSANVGIKDDSPDLVLVVSDVPAAVAGVFTKSRFVGPSVSLSREVVADGAASGVVVVSKNANVANGPEGDQDAAALRARAASVAGVAADRMVVASTGVIGRRYPTDKLWTHFDEMPPLADEADFAAAAEAIMTTDTTAKIVRRQIGDATLVGIAKGVGMIEPNMATLLVFFFTDARVGSEPLDTVFRLVVDRTFNALSIDTDTSTSDTAVIFANGLAGDVDTGEFTAALADAALTLVRMIAADGEGATTVIEVEVTGARDEEQAKRVAKAVVNSPLVKTAVHGADPNWGRIVMAVGKCQDDVDIDPERVAVAIGGVPMYPGPADDVALAAAADHLRGDVAHLGVDLGIADGEFVAFGCDLTDGYVRINADYTT